MPRYPGFRRRRTLGAAAALPKASRPGSSFMKRRQAPVVRRNRNKYKPTIRVIRGLQQIVPDILRTQLRYAEMWSVPEVNNVFNRAYVYRGNSIYDPYVGIYAGQPNGVAELERFYSEYRCYGSKIKVTMINQFSGEVNNLCIFPTTDDTISNTLSANDYQEFPYAKSRLGGTANGVDRTVVKNYMTTSKMWGVRKIYADEYVGTLSTVTSITGNPANTWFWIILLTNVGQSATKVRPVIKVEITYYVDVFNRKENIISSVDVDEDDPLTCIEPEAQAGIPLTCVDVPPPITGDAERSAASSPPGRDAGGTEAAHASASCSLINKSKHIGLKTGGKKKTHIKYKNLIA